MTRLPSMTVLLGLCISLALSACPSDEAIDVTPDTATADVAGETADASGSPDTAITDTSVAPDADASDSEPDADAKTEDATSDTGTPDAVLDASPDAAVDAVPDATADVAPDAVADAAADSASDGGEADAAADANNTDTSDAASTPDVAADVTPVDPVIGGWTKVDVAFGARAAVALASCLPRDTGEAPDDAVAGYLRDFYLPTVKWENQVGMHAECLAAATNGCASVDACIQSSVTQGANIGDTCINGVYEWSYQDLRVAQSCTALGMVCIMQGNKPKCGLSQPPSCANSGQFTCSGDTPTPCLGGSLRTGLDCSTWGLTCAEDTFFGGLDLAVCQGANGSCSPDAANWASLEHNGVSCQGDLLEACVNGGLHNLDCGDMGIGLSCQSAGGAYFCGAASECNPATYQATCSGTTLTVCNAGRLEQVDCADMGFTGCSAQDAVCTPSVF